VDLVLVTSDIGDRIAVTGVLLLLKLNLAMGILILGPFSTIVWATILFEELVVVWQHVEKHASEKVSGVHSLPGDSANLHSVVARYHA
jgi:hypothetical protein